MGVNLFARGAGVGPNAAVVGVVPTRSVYGWAARPDNSTFLSWGNIADCACAPSGRQGYANDAW